MAEDCARRGRLVSLAMYADPPPVRIATRRLWAHVRDTLRGQGTFADVPDAPDDTLAPDAAWSRPDLLLAQTCGYPFARRLHGTVRLVATPCYDHPGCAGAFGTSFIVVRADEPARSLAGLIGRRAGINDRDSNSGYNLLRAAVAPFARDGRFFGEVTRTGGHAASLAAVADGVADVAAIDCVTWANYRRFAPDRLTGLRILGATATTPWLPLITGGAASDAEVALLRSALHRAAADTAMAPTLTTLGLRGFAELGEAEYAVVLALERAAIGLGYPTIA